MESKPADFRRCSGSHVCTGTPDGTPTGNTVADTSRHTFTRGRAVEHEATTLLSARGYQIFLCSGTQSPIDLIAWSPQGHPALIKTERSRISVGEVQPSSRNGIVGIWKLSASSYSHSSHSCSCGYYPLLMDYGGFSPSFPAALRRSHNAHNFSRLPS